MAIFSEKIKIRNDEFWIKLLSDLVEKVTLVDKDITVYVFGSFVTEGFTNASDLDIAVIVPDLWSTKDFYDRVYRINTVNVDSELIHDSKSDKSKHHRLISWPLDLLVFKKSLFDSKKEVGGVCFDIFHEGRIIYSGSDHHIPLKDVLNQLQEDLWPRS